MHEGKPTTINGTDTGAVTETSTPDKAPMAMCSKSLYHNPPRNAPDELITVVDLVRFPIEYQCLTSLENLESICSIVLFFC